MTTRMDLSYEGIGEMLCAAFMQREMRRRAEKVKPVAESFAPRDDDPDDGPAYADCFEVSSGVKTSDNGTMRAYGRVTNTSPHASAVEWGFRNVPRHRVLGRAMMAAGDE